MQVKLTLYGVRYLCCVQTIAQLDQQKHDLESKNREDEAKFIEEAKNWLAKEGNQISTNS